MCLVHSFGQLNEIESSRGEKEENNLQKRHILKRREMQEDVKIAVELKGREKERKNLVSTKTQILF